MFMRDNTATPSTQKEKRCALLFSPADRILFIFQQQTAGLLSLHLIDTLHILVHILQIRYIPLIAYTGAAGGRQAPWNRSHTSRNPPALQSTAGEQGAQMGMKGSDIPVQNAACPFLFIW
jgi:hypothetical protein